MLVYEVLESDVGVSARSFLFCPFIFVPLYTFVYLIARVILVPTSPVSFREYFVFDL